MSTQEEPLINPNDFKSIRLDISLNNLTTKTKIEGGKRVFDTLKTGSPEEGLHLELVEVVDGFLTLETPPKIGAQGHILEIKIVTENRTPEIEVEVQGEIHAIEPLPDGRLQVVIQLVNPSDPSWLNLLAMYSQRQDEIEKFFSSVKGY
jgi:hypothetical protein